MKRIKYDLTQSELEILVEHYFNGTTSEHEEAVLKHCLLHTKYKRTPAIEEALAVISYNLNASYKHKIVESKHKLPIIASIAASIAVILGITAHFHLSYSNPDICEMYINGVKITDQNIIINSVEQDLHLLASTIGSTDNIVNEQLSEFSPILN